MQRVICRLQCSRCLCWASREGHDRPPWSRSRIMQRFLTARSACLPLNYYWVNRIWKLHRQNTGAWGTTCRSSDHLWHRWWWRTIWRSEDRLLALQSRSWRLIRLSWTRFPPFHRQDHLPLAHCWSKQSGSFSKASARIWGEQTRV